jgi:NAD(P)-dependent dehydrogenase (short-subunit alcohol dehydrogenase family)
MTLRERVAIVTGAASGIGLGIATALGREGTRVVIADVNEAGAREAALQLGGSGVPCCARAMDVSSSADVNRAVEWVIAQYGRIDILVNNAAYLGFSAEHLPFVDTGEEEWDRHIDVTLKGTLHCCKAVVPHMLSQGGGCIVNVTSDASKVGPPSGEALYAAAKSAVAGFTRGLAVELAPRDIRVNSVSPGFIMTPSVLATRSEEWCRKVAAHIPLGHPGRPADIGEMVAFLASDRAGFITGQHYSVNGGRNMLAC